MANLAVRDISDESYRSLAQQAKDHGRSISAEVRAMIDEAARKRRAMELIDKIERDRIADNMKIAGGLDSVALVRLMRDE
jgi:hypothetical protein